MEVIVFPSVFGYSNASRQNYGFLLRKDVQNCGIQLISQLYIWLHFRIPVLSFNVTIIQVSDFNCIVSCYIHQAPLNTVLHYFKKHHLKCYFNKKTLGNFTTCVKKLVENSYSTL